MLMEPPGLKVVSGNETSLRHVIKLITVQDCVSSSKSIAYSIQRQRDAHRHILTDRFCE